MKKITKKYELTDETIEVSNDNKKFFRNNK